MAVRRDRRAGFLLTETLATFTISAFVLLGLVSASSVLLHAVDRSVAHVQDVDDLSRTIGAIERDVSGLARVNFDGLQPTPYVFRGGPNSLYFANSFRGVDGVPELQAVAIREIVSGSGTRLVRADARLPSMATSFDELRFGPQRDLATGPARLRFYYVGRQTTGAPETRLKNWPSGLKLPVAVIVEAVDAATNRLILTTRVPLRANADIACLSRSDRRGAPGPAYGQPGGAAIGGPAFGQPAASPLGGPAFGQPAPQPLGGQLAKADGPDCGPVDPMPAVEGRSL